MLLIAMAVHGSVRNDGWTIGTGERENYSGVTLGNGRIGIVAAPTLLSASEIVLNGVFDKESEGGVSRMVRAPLFMNLVLRIDGREITDDDVTGWHQQLDMRRACITTTFRYKDATVTYTMRAMRNLPYMAIGTLVVSTSSDADIEVAGAVTFPEELKHRNTAFRVMRDGKSLLPVCVSSCKSRTLMNDIFATTTFLLPDDERAGVCFDDGRMTYRRHLAAGASCVVPLAGAVCTSRDFNDPKGESERMAVYALQHDYHSLIRAHEEAWQELWQGDIIIEGCPADQLDVRMSLYNLYSFQREGSRLGISPMGLSSSQGYNGHVFWDSELWMFPPVLVLNPALARCHIDYRSDRLPKALQRASLFGYRGAMFPWESDDSGEESTPTWCLTGTFEHHVTADVGIAFWNYYRVTRDIEWLRGEGFRVMRAVADFWVSRAERNTDGSYSVRNVVGADEYAQNIDDNAFTNGSARVALRAASKAAALLGIPHDSRWDDVAERLRFHYMADGTLKEHSTYAGEMIKQADVNLLAYPLKVVTDTAAIRRDIDYYEDRMDRVNGPAMGSSILSVLYSRLGDTDRAYELFRRSYEPNKRPPYGVLSESASSSNPYFATGAGGMLQAAIFGFAGIDITDDGIVCGTPHLPSAWKSLTIKGQGIKDKIIRIENKRK